MLLELEVPDRVRETGGLRPSGVALGRRLGIGVTGELVGSWHEKLGFH